MPPTRLSRLLSRYEYSECCSLHPDSCAVRRSTHNRTLQLDPCDVQLMSPSRRKEPDIWINLLAVRAAVSGVLLLRVYMTGLLASWAYLVVVSLLPLGADLTPLP